MKYRSVIPQLTQNGLCKIVLIAGDLQPINGEGLTECGLIK